ncbi:IPT/TIG domain protein, partial [Ancylostoma duodenale]
MSDGDRLAPPGTRAKGPPTVTGLSPTEGTPGTQITIRGENLGTDQNDLLMLFICGTDCLHTAKWKTDKKIVARLGQANRGLGEVKIATKSGGRGICNVKFRVFIAQVGPLEESAVWVDETQTVPGRE